MADISKVEINGVTYNVKDTYARQQLEQIQNSGGNTGGGATSWDDLGKGYGIGELLKETTLTATETVLSEELPLTAGYEYTVTWNGTEYVRTAKDLSAIAGVEGSAYVGNFSGNTGEPFFISYKPGTGTTVSIVSGSAPATVSISGYGLVTIPIPGKYLPEGTPWIGEVGTVVVLPETTLDMTNGGGLELPYSLGLVDGQTYTVKWRGVEYECVARAMIANTGDPGIAIGYFYGSDGVDEDKSFGFLDLGYMTLVNSVGDYSPAECSITTETTTKKITPRCLPVGYPHYAYGTVFKETTAIEAELPGIGPGWALMPAPTLELGKTYTVRYNGTDYRCECMSAPSNLTSDPQATAMGNFSVIGGANTGEPFAMMLSPEAGTILIIDLVGSETVSVAISGDVLVPFDRKYLPGSIYTVTFDVYMGDSEGVAKADKSIDEVMEIAKDPNVLVRAFVRNHGYGVDNFHDVVGYFYGELTSALIASSSGYLYFMCPDPQNALDIRWMQPNGAITVRYVR